MAVKMKPPRDPWKRFAMGGRAVERTQEQEYREEIEKAMRRCLTEIEAQIEAWYQKYASDEGISIADAKRRISKADIEFYATLAERYVDQKNFSPVANAQMKLYNAKLKINRMSAIEAVIGMELAGTFSDIEKYIDGTLEAGIRAEMDRYAEALGTNINHPVERIHNIVHESLKNADWTDRLWYNNEEKLRAYLETALESALIAGKSPRAMVKDFRRHFESSEEDALTLLNTEMCRCQTGAAKLSLEENENEYYKYVTTNPVHPCKVCLGLEERTAKKPIKVADMQPGINAPPMHPNCHCCVAPWVDEEAYNRWLDNFKYEGDETDDTVVYT